MSTRTRLAPWSYATPKSTARPTSPELHIVVAMDDIRFQIHLLAVYIEGLGAWGCSEGNHPRDAGPTSAAPIKVPANTAGISCFLFIRLTSFFPLLSLCSLQQQHTGNLGKSLQQRAVPCGENELGNSSRLHNLHRLHLPAVVPLITHAGVESEHVLGGRGGALVSVSLTFSTEVTS